MAGLDGQRYYLGPHGTWASKSEYDRLIAEWLQHGRHIQPVKARPALSVIELIVAYVHYADGYYRKDGKPRRHSNYEYGVRGNAALEYGSAAAFTQSKRSQQAPTGQRTMKRTN